MKYYIAFSFSFLIAVLIIPACNYYIDWYGFFQQPESGTIQSIRTIRNTNTELNTPIIRTKNAIDILKTESDVILLMGSSRVHRGFLSSQLSKQLGMRVVKLTYPGGNLAEHLQTLKAIIKNSNAPRRVIIGIDDYFLTENPAVAKATINRSIYPVNGFKMLGLYKDNLFRKVKINDISLLFSSEVKTYDAISGQPFPPKQANQAHYRKMINLDPYLNIDPQLNHKKATFYINEYLDIVDELVTLTEHYNIELTLFFTPRWISTSYMRDHSKLFAFKNGLVKQHPFFDFSGATVETTTPRYWSEASHFTTEVGEIVGQKLANPEDIELFGRFVTRDNIYSHLEELKQNLADNIDPWIAIKPDMQILSRLKTWLYENYQQRDYRTQNIITLNSSQWEKTLSKRGRLSSGNRVDLLITPLENADRIQLPLSGPTEQYYSGENHTGRMTIELNHTYYGEVQFGNGEGLSNNKIITIFANFSKEITISLIFYNDNQDTMNGPKPSMGVLLSDSVMAAHR